MKISFDNAINFQRRLRSSEEAEYSDVLKKAGGKGRRVLIVPASSLPNETGVGNLGTKESLEFFDFAKRYWGINEIQILPTGQYHEHKGEYPIYSGTSMDLGNHMINVKDYAHDLQYQIIPEYRGDKKRVNFHNVVDDYSTHNKAIKELHFEKAFNEDFQKFKLENKKTLEPKALYRALREINRTHDFNRWNDLDKNLFNPDLVKESERNRRIQEVYKLKGEDIDFYYFKQFLAEDSLKKAKNELNKKGLKLNGDMLCGFSYDEVWSNPKAFHKNTTIGWGLPAVDFDSKEGENLFRQKVKFYAERFDGVRVDASWSYINQPQIKEGLTNRKYYGDKILNIIDEEFKKVKGSDYDLHNIMHEFATSHENFSIYDCYELKPFVKDRVKIYTSEYLSESWGSNKNFLERGWKPDSFSIGTSNHDSKKLEVTEEQAKTLSKILKIPYEKLTSRKEFVKAKFAEPMGAQNNMIYFIDALNLDGQFLHNSKRELNYATQIPDNYQEHYFKSLENGEGFNPMDALEKSFKARGLDKQDPALYKKIVKYRKILEQKEKQTFPRWKWIVGIACSGLVLYGLFKHLYNKPHSDSI